MKRSSSRFFANEASTWCRAKTGKLNACSSFRGAPERQRTVPILLRRLNPDRHKARIPQDPGLPLIQQRVQRQVDRDWHADRIDEARNRLAVDRLQNAVGEQVDVVGRDTEQGSIENIQARVDNAVDLRKPTVASVLKKSRRWC